MNQRLGSLSRSSSSFWSASSFISVQHPWSVMRELWKPKKTCYFLCCSSNTCVWLLWIRYFETGTSRIMIFLLMAAYKKMDTLLCLGETHRSSARRFHNIHDDDDEWCCFGQNVEHRIIIHFSWSLTVN